MFERQYNNTKIYGMNFPTGALVSRLLRIVGISKISNNLPELSFLVCPMSTRKNNYNAMYNNKNQENSISSVKVESVFETKGYNVNSR